MKNKSCICSTLIRWGKEIGILVALCVFMVLLCIFVVVCVFFGVKGYQMYKEAVAEKPISERVEEIHGMEGFTPYSELPQFYIDTTISVEDHWFEEHCGIDLIAIGRAALMDIKERSFVQGGSTITQYVK